MDLEGRLEAVVARHLPGNQYFITEIKAVRAGSKTKIAIYVDGDQGMDIGTCAHISRKVGHELDLSGILDHPYTLEVSSPGVDRPLKLPRQYRKHLGRQVRIQMPEKKVEGTLLEVNEKFVVIREKAGKKEQATQYSIPFSDIVTTHVLVSF